MENENNHMHRRSYRNLIIYASILLAVIVTLCLELYSFAGVQDIWLDESTQLSGITLKPWEMLQWLSGVALDRFGVPGDRMPPLSYMLDLLWLHLSGPSVLGFRLFHSAFVILGAAVLAALALRELGPLAATIILGFLAFSPKLIQTGVEIRAYPIFFFITSAQVAVFLKLVTKNKIDLKLLAAFTLISLTAIYTHFYGLVSTCAFFFALGIAFIRSTASLVTLAIACIILTIGSLGLLPFVSSAVIQSSPAATEKTNVQYFTYLLRLFGDSANMVSVVASLFFFSGTLALFSAGTIAAFARARRGIVQPLDWLYPVVAAGVLAPIIASTVTKTFNVLNASYSGWLFAPLVLLIGAGTTSLTGFRPWDQVGRLVATGAMLIGAALSTSWFLTHASMFVHGPQRFVGTFYDETEFPKAIVYEAGAAWAFSYFPLVFSHHREIIQYRAAENGVGLIRIEGSQSHSTVRDIESALAPYNDLLLVDVRLRTFRDLRACQDHSISCPQFASGEIGEWLTGTGRWIQSKTERSFGLYDTEIRLFKKANQGVTPNVINNQ